MSKRLARNLIAVLLVIAWYAVLLSTAGCQSTIEMRKGAENTASYERILVKARPKDFQALDFTWHETKLKAGAAATAPDPWAEVLGDGVDVIGVIAFCRANPEQC